MITQYQFSAAGQVALPTFEKDIVLTEACFNSSTSGVYAVLSDTNETAANIYAAAGFKTQVICLLGLLMGPTIVQLNNWIVPARTQLYWATSGVCEVTLYYEFREVTAV